MPVIPVIPAWPTPPNRLTMTPAEFAEAAAAFLEAFPSQTAAFNAAFPQLVAAAASANPTGTSTTSMTIGTGTFNPEFEPGKTLIGGMFAVIADASAPTENYMFGQIVNYDFATGDMEFASIEAHGSGTHTAWLIGVSGPQGPEGSPYPSIGGNAYNLLSVNGAASGIEWIDPRWELIDTASPSAVTEQAFTSLKSAAYSDLLILCDLDLAASAILRIALSADGSTYSPPNSVVGSTDKQALMAIQINGYRFSWGLLTQGAILPADYPSPSMSAGTGAVTPWTVTGGIDAIKIDRNDSNFTGTITIYGRR